MSYDYGTGNLVFIEHFRKGMKKINNDSKIVKTAILNSHNYVSVLCYVK